MMHESYRHVVRALADGTVVAEYATGVSLGAAGVVSGGDMTVEAALTKMGCLLGRGLPPDVVRRKMGTVTRGERTMIVEHKRFSLHDKYVMLRAIKSQLQTFCTGMLPVTLSENVSS